MAYDLLKQNEMIEDLTRISALRGDIGEEVADKTNEINLAETKLKRLKAERYKYHKPRVKSENNDKATAVDMENELNTDKQVMAEEDKILPLQHELDRLTLMRDSLLGLENSLKKALEAAKIK